MKKIQKCRTTSLDALFEDTAHSLSFFESISFTHVYRERNKEVDMLSKKGLTLHWGEWKILETQDSKATEYPHMPFINPSL